MVSIETLGCASTYKKTVVLSAIGADEKQIDASKKKLQKKKNKLGNNG